MSLLPRTPETPSLSAQLLFFLLQFVRPVPPSQPFRSRRAQVWPSFPLASLDTGIVQCDSPQVPFSIDSTQGRTPHKSYNFAQSGQVSTRAPVTVKAIVHCRPATLTSRQTLSTELRKRYYYWLVVCCRRLSAARESLSSRSAWGWLADCSQIFLFCALTMWVSSLGRWSDWSMFGRLIAAMGSFLPSWSYAGGF